VRILICTQPILGHVEPGLVIAEALRVRGHEVAWYTGTCMRERIEARGFRFHPIVKAFDYDGSRPHVMFPERKNLSGIADLKFILKRVFNDGMPLQVEDIEAILEKEPADVLLADFVTFGPRAVHERGGPVWAAFGFSALTLSSVDTAPYGLGLAPDASAFGRVRNRALRVLSDGIVFRDVVRHHDRVRKSLNLPSKRTSPMDTPLSPFLFLQGTVPEFEYPRSDLPEQVHFVGALVPAPKVRPFEAPSWWPELKERKRPVILVTQGTMDNTDLGELVRPTLRALRDANVTVCLLYTSPSPRD
jgi:UDP:flavonoid glycosyltransferase YjiC (YdhE family)